MQLKTDVKLATRIANGLTVGGVKHLIDPVYLKVLRKVRPLLKANADR